MLNVVFRSNSLASAESNPHWREPSLHSQMNLELTRSINILDVKENIIAGCFRVSAAVSQTFMSGDIMTLCFMSW